MKTEYYAYIHCKPDGTPFYIGKGGDRRAASLVRRNLRHQNTVQKYGAENILVGKFACSSEAIAFALEKGLIKCFRRMGVALCNLTDGGEGIAGYKMTPMQLAAHSAARKGKKPQPTHIESRRKGLVMALATKEARARLSAATKKAWADPTVRARRMAGITRSWENNEDRKERTSQTQKIVGGTEAARAERKERLAAQWADPAAREQRVAAMRAVAATQEMRERKSAATKAGWADPDSRARRIAAIKAARNTPESKARTSAASKKAAAVRKAKNF